MSGARPTESGPRKPTGASGLELEDGNMGHRPGVKGGYFPVPPVDSHRRPARGDVPGDGGDGAHRRGPSPRGRNRRSVRDRHPVREPHPQGRRAPDPQVLRAQRGSRVRQDRDLHAEAARRRQRQRNALPPVPRRRAGKNLFSGEQVRRSVAGGAVVHRGHLQACARAERVHQRRHQQLQASGEGVRGADPARILGTQPLRFGADSALERRRRAPRRSAFPGLQRQRRT